MNLNERFDVSPQKLDQLRERIERLKISLPAIQESFVRGGGKGGQKINKTANCVLLVYPPLKISVRCQQDRRRTVNRFLALRELVDQVEMKISPGTSSRLEEHAAARKKKARRSAKSKTKYAAPPALVLCCLLICCLFSACGKQFAKRRYYIPGNPLTFEAGKDGQLVARNSSGEIELSAVTVGETVIVRDPAGRPIQRTLRAHLEELVQ